MVARGGVNGNAHIIPSKTRKLYVLNQMPSLKKRKNIRESKNAIEGGGWDGGSKLEGELLS